MITYDKNIDVAAISALCGFKPDPFVDLVEWSDTFRYLPKESSVEPGKYYTRRVPYGKEILRELSPQSATQEVISLKPTQMGFTELANNFLFAIAHRYPGPCLMAMPTDDMAKRHVKKKIAPSIRAMPCLKGIIKDSRARDSGNTLNLKEFPGGSWTFTGSNSPTSARSDSVKFLILDDYDGFVNDLGAEGNPGELFRKRTDAFGNKRKIYINSTPTTIEKSKIAKEYEESSQGEYHVPCPHCGHYQYLIFGDKDIGHGIKFAKTEHSEISDIWYVCEACGCRIDEHEKTWMLENGEYVHRYPERKKRGFKVNSLYSPVGWVSWGQVAEEFLKAKGDRQRLQVWMNTRMAEVFDDKEAVNTESVITALRDDRPFGIVPADVIACITAGVDTQQDGFWFEIRAWGYGLQQESWQIRAGFVDSFQALANVLWESAYTDTKGRGYVVKLVVMDAMGGTRREEPGYGTRTSEVYDFCRTHRGQIYPLKGEQRMNQTHAFTKLEFYPGGNKPIPGGLNLVRANVGFFKNQLNSKLQILPGDPGAWHMSADMSDAWARHMCSEWINQKGEWEQISKANHGWDCSVYNLVAAEILGVKHWRKKDEAATPEKPAHDHKETPRPAGSRARPEWFNKR